MGAMTIAHGLKHTSSLEHIDVSGNPIGQFGMRLLMQTLTLNQNAEFTINLKNIAAEYDRKLLKNPNDSALNFNPANPEGKYSLDLSEAYNQVVFQHLL